MLSRWRSPGWTSGKWAGWARLMCRFPFQLPFQCGAFDISSSTYKVCIVIREKKAVPVMQTVVLCLNWIPKLAFRTKLLRRTTAIWTLQLFRMASLEHVVQCHMNVRPLAPQVVHQVSKTLCGSPVTGLTRGATTQDDATKSLDIEKPLDALSKINRITFSGKLLQSSHAWPIWWI